MRAAHLGILTAALLAGCTTTVRDRVEGWYPSGPGLAVAPPGGPPRHEAWNAQRASRFAPEASTDLAVLLDRPATEAAETWVCVSDYVDAVVWHEVVQGRISWAELRANTGKRYFTDVLTRPERPSDRDLFPVARSTYADCVSRCSGPKAQPAIAQHYAERCSAFVAEAQRAEDSRAEAQRAAAEAEASRAKAAAPPPSAEPSEVRARAQRDLDRQADAILQAGVPGETWGQGGIGLSGIGPGGSGVGIGPRQGSGGLRANPAQVRVEAIEVRGRLPREVIERVTAQHRGRMRLCYESALRSRPDLQGRVTVQFVIGPKGSVTSAKGDGSDLPDANVVNCVVRAITGITFPEPEGGVVSVRYPVAFSPGKLAKQP